MKNKCTHTIKSLRVVQKHSSSPDGYGGDNEWDWYDFECSKCEKSTKVKEEGRVWHFGYEEYHEVTGRTLTLAELKRVFKQNIDLYECLNIERWKKDKVLVDLGYRTPELETKIKRKEKLIKKHKDELYVLEKQYNGYK